MAMTIQSTVGNVISTFILVEVDVVLFDVYDRLTKKRVCFSDDLRGDL